MNPSTKIHLSDALASYFNVEHDYAMFPLTCNCGEEVRNLSGVAVHLKKVHRVYIKRTRGLIKEKLKLKNQV